MAKGTKELKRRIRGVGNIKQITRAMEMVATTKLKRLHGRAAASRPYSDKIQEVVGRLAGMPGMEDASPLMEVREVKRVALIMVSSDRGLCGAYNSNIIRMAVRYEAEHPGPGYGYNLFGKKGWTFLRRRPQYSVDYNFGGTLEKIAYSDVKEIGRALQAAFIQGRIDEARIFYTSFVSTMVQRPTEQKLLPISPSGALKSCRHFWLAFRMRHLSSMSRNALVACWNTAMNTSSSSAKTWARPAAIRGRRSASSL